jgi:hypothetical protein
MLGLAGELLNLSGAIVLARDLIARDEENAERERLSSVYDWALRSGLKSTFYRKQNVASQNFAQSIADLRAKSLGYKGVILLISGFALLALYHFWEFFIP